MRWCSRIGSRVNRDLGAAGTATMLLPPPAPPATHAITPAAIEPFRAIVISRRAHALKAEGWSAFQME